MAPEHSPTRPLVGREREIADLESLVGVGGSPRSGGVLLAGDAGVGKTRLLTELRGRATESGWRVLLGHCLDFGDSALPYLPFSEILGRLVNDDSARAAALTDHYPALRHLQPGRRLLTSAVGDPEATERVELFEAVHAALEHLAAAGPLLVVVEDVHWADQSTRDLLSFLFTRSFTRPVVLVASYRSDDLHRRHPLRATAAQWGRLPGVHRLPLPGLSDAAVRDLVRVIHPGPLAESDVHAIVTRADGNAFFTEELVGAAELGSPSLPDDLADLLLVRLDQLDDDARAVVRAAACAGRQVSHALLAAVVDLTPDRLEQALRSAVERNVLVSRSAGGYAFRHALLAEAVYDDLLPGERVRLHAAYVTALGRHDVPGTAAELARHARLAHDRVTAVTASIEAGSEAMAVGGPDEAAAHYELALELLGDPAARPEEMSDIDLVSVTSRASEALLNAGHPHRALALVADQLDRLPAEAPDRDRARLLVTLSQAALLSDTTVNALQASTEALHLLPPEPSALRAKAMSAHARANADRQRDEEAMRWALQARDLGEELGISRVVVDAATTIARLEDKLGNPEESRRSLEKVVAQARAGGDTSAELRGLHQLGGLHFEAGQLAEAGRVYDEASARASRCGLEWAPYGFDVRVMAAITSYILGDWAEVDRTVDVSGQSPPGMAEAALTAVALSVAAGRGDVAALSQLPRLREWWDRDGFIAIQTGVAAIDLYGDAGDLAAAVAVHDDVVATVTSLWQVPSFLARVRFAALLVGQYATHAPELSEDRRAELVAHGRSLLEEAGAAVRSAEARNRRIGPEGRAWEERARAEHLRLRWLAGVDVPEQEELVEAWERTAKAFDGLGHRFEWARSEARLAAVLRAQGRPGDAREHGDAARAAAHDLGAEPLLAELRDAGTEPAGRRGGRDGGHPADALTPREREILALVALGRSNGEIGRQLFISTKTVSVHVSRILAKLGARGRTEAVALARRQGLLDD